MIACLHGVADIKQRGCRLYIISLNWRIRLFQLPIHSLHTPLRMNICRYALVTYASQEFQLMLLYNRILYMPKSTHFELTSVIPCNQRCVYFAIRN